MAAIQILLAGAGTTLFQTIAKALGLGSVYVVMALGFVIIFKATQVLNFAAGALSMAGALFLVILVSDKGLPFLPFSNPLAPPDGAEGAGLVAMWSLNVLFALVLAGLFGLVVERVAIRPMVGQPLFAMAVITLGVELTIEPFDADAVSPNARPLSVPWGANAWNWFGAQIPKSYVIAVGVALVATALVLVFYRSRYGVAMRAVAFDQEAAMAQGIRVGQVFAIAWGLGAALSALAAILYGWAPLPGGGNVTAEHPLMAFRVLPVVVLGGLDSVKGAIYSGFLIAGAEIFAGQYLARWDGILGAGYQTIVPYVVMLIVLFVRPYGLFGTAEVRRV